MNKNFLKAVSFFALCVFSYYLIAYFAYSETLARKLSPVSQVKQHEDFWGDSEVYDWVVLGSSHAYRGLDPKFFEAKGLRFFNLGSSSQTPVNSLEILRKLPGKTRGVILDIYSVTFNLSGRESFYDLLSSGYSAQILTPMWLHVANARSLQLLLSKPLIDIKNEKVVPHEVSYKGYVSTDVQASAETKYTKYSLYHKENLEKQWKAFEELLQVAKANDLKLVLVMAPLPKALVIEGEAAFNKRLLEVIKPFSVTLVDASRTHPLDAYRDFFDSDHLNSQGVRWWNQKILESYSF